MVDFCPPESDLIPMMAERRRDIMAVMRALPARRARAPRPTDMRVPGEEGKG